MRLRVGYVSNSSSTSFIVYGAIVDYSDVEKLISDGYEVICILDSKGTSGDVADFVFTVTQYRLKVLSEHGIDISNGEFIQVKGHVCVGENDELMITSPLSGGRLMEIDEDYSSPNSDSDNDQKFADWVEFNSEI